MNTCFFFFSSRRRHTRSDRDWSSDVCSSDLEPRLTISREMPFLPQHVRRGERRMAAQVHLDGGREPAEAVAVALGMQKRRLGEVHLARDVLHPGWVGRAAENADGGGIAGGGGGGGGGGLKNAKGPAA